MSHTWKKPRLKSITEVRIVEAAVQLFSRNGFKGSSTRDIAQLAEVNEATLFRYFNHNTNLFWAAAASRLNRLRMGQDLQAGLARGDDPAVIMPMLMTFLMDSLLR
jgi:AcrR family transcriptional regulator